MVIKFPFKWDNYLKPVTSMLVGTPELEISFSHALLLRSDRDCRVSRRQEPRALRCTLPQRRLEMIGSAYVDL